MVYGVIYVITNLLTGMKYVGQTTRSLKERFREHMKSDYLIGRAIRHYGVENFTVEVIEECATPEQLNEREIFWIAKLNTKHPHGYNFTDGGQQGASPSAESRKKMSDAHTGVKRSPETVARMSESQKGKVLSLEHRTKLSEAGRGHEVSPEIRKKISEAQKGKKLSPETRAKLKGRIRSHEFCEKMSKALKGRKLSLETRRKISEAQKGRSKRRQTVYPVLSAELIRQKVSYAKLGELLGYSHATISKRMQGSPEFTPEQQAAIKKFLGVDMSVEELFRRQ